jgi:hypothetical protein
LTVLRVITTSVSSSARALSTTSGAQRLNGGRPTTWHPHLVLARMPPQPSKHGVWSALFSGTSWITSQ